MPSKAAKPKNNINDKEKLTSATTFLDSRNRYLGAWIFLIIEELDISDCIPQLVASL